MTANEAAAPAVEEFELSGGALCLDFANTLGDRPRATSEHLRGYEDLLRWSRQAAALSPDQLDRLEHDAEEHPRRARAAFERAIELRETLYRIFACLAADRRPRPEDLASLNAALAEALPHLEVCEDPPGAERPCFGWVWCGEQETLERPLWPIARSAADLLTSGKDSAVRECASETCSWLFLDRSRSRRRRWCDMATCGNRAKARRHYERRKQSKVQSKGPS